MENESFLSPILMFTHLKCKFFAKSLHLAELYTYGENIVMLPIKLNQLPELNFLKCNIHMKHRNLIVRNKLLEYMIMVSDKFPKNYFHLQLSDVNINDKKSRVK